jgi:uncharacterized protein
LTDFATALGLVLVIEGVLYALLPETLPRMAARLAEMPAPTIRGVGLAAAVAGLVVVRLVRG